jgi:hypothetical protein
MSNVIHAEDRFKIHKEDDWVDVMKFVLKNHVATKYPELIPTIRKLKDSDYENTDR